MITVIKVTWRLEGGIPKSWFLGTSQYIVGGHFIAFGDQVLAGQPEVRESSQYGRHTHTNRSSGPILHAMRTEPTASLNPSITRSDNGSKLWRVGFGGFLKGAQLLGCRISPYF